MSEAVVREPTKEVQQAIQKYFSQWVNAFEGRLSVSEELLYPLDRTHLAERDEIRSGLNSLSAMVSEFVEGRRSYSSQKHGVEDISSRVPTSGEDLGTTHTETICYLEVPSLSGRLPTDHFKGQILFRAVEMIEGEANQTFEGAVEAQISRVLTDFQESQRSVSAEKPVISKEEALKSLTILMGVRLAEYELTYNEARWDEGTGRVVARRAAGIRVAFFPKGRIAVFGVVYAGGLPALLDKPLAEYRDNLEETVLILKAFDQFAAKAEETAKNSDIKAQKRRF